MRGEVHENRAECLFSLLKPSLRVFRGKLNLPGYVGFFQFLRNFRQHQAFEQVELILRAALDPSTNTPPQGRAPYACPRGGAMTDSGDCSGSPRSCQHPAPAATGGIADLSESKNLARACVCVLGLHVGAQNSVDACLIAALLPEPCQQIRVKPDGDDLLTPRHDNLGVFPELLVCRVRVRVSLNARVNVLIAQLAQLVPVGAALSLRGFRCFASRSVFHGVLRATLR